MILKNNMKNKKRVIIACDFENKENLFDFLGKISSIDKSKYILKIGLQMFIKYGNNILDELKDYDLFLDLKMHDIPNTILGALNSIKKHKNIIFTTVTLTSSTDFSYIKNKKWPFKILGVTVLTSLTQKDLLNLGFSDSIFDQIIRLIKIAYKNNFDGVICSAKDSLIIKNKYPDLLTVCPGIRLEGFQDDQKRIATPEEASENKVDYIVIGRPLTRSKNPKDIFEDVYAKFI